MLVQNPCLGDVTCAGYTVAKHGILAMTRAFQTCHPKPRDSEGIKCYALCPSLVDTNMVRKSIEHNCQRGVTDGWNANTSSLDEFVELAKIRAMSGEEIGDALMKSFKLDKIYSRYTNIQRIYFKIINYFVKQFKWLSSI